MSIQTADEHLLAGRDALRLALREHAVPCGQLEDLVPDLVSLKCALGHFDAAASLYRAAGRAIDEARVHIDRAEVFLNMRLSEDSCTAASASCRAALEVLDSVEDPTAALKAYVLFAEATEVLISHAPENFDKERQITRTLGVLRAAEHLAVEQDDPLLRARVEAALSRILAESYRGDRDANLLDAIRVGQRALPVFRLAQARAPLRYPSLQVHIGNCYMKLDGPRSQWLEAGIAAFRDGLTIVDPGEAPQLHRVLTGKLAMVEALIAERNSLLPKKEIMERLVAKLRSALDDGELYRAEEIAWETLQRAWSLGEVPDVWVAEAHKLIGGLELDRGNASLACPHFYSAVALLSVLTEPGGPQQAALLSGAKQLLGDALARLGQANQTEVLINEASSAFVMAREHCARGSQLLTDDPKAAHDEFERALALFPYDPLTVLFRGIASMSLSNPETACHDFDKVLGLQPRNIPALINRALVKTQIGDADGALADYASVLDIDPQNIAALYSRSVLLVVAGDCEAAVKELDQLLAAHPDVAEARELRTECLARLGQRGTT